MLNHTQNAARTSSANKRMAAIVVSGGRVVGRGTNRVPNNTAEVGEDALLNSTHAEVAALRNCGTKLKNATIYVARLGKSGLPRMAKPCVNCQKALREAGVKKVVYTIDSSITL